LVGDRAQQLDLLAERLPRGLTMLVERQKSRLAALTGQLSPARLREGASRRRNDLVLLSGRLAFGLGRSSRDARSRFANLGARLSLDPAQRQAARGRSDLTKLSAQLETLASAQIKRAGERLAAAERMRQTLGYRETLKRGYAVIRDGAGQVLPEKAKAASAKGLEIEFRDGRLKVGSGSMPKPGGRKSDDQGSLF